MIWSYPPWLGKLPWIQRLSEKNSPSCIQVVVGSWIIGMRSKGSSRNMILCEWWWFTFDYVDKIWPFFKGNTHSKMIQHVAGKNKFWFVVVPFMCLKLAGWLVWLPSIFFSQKYWVSIIIPIDSYFSEGWRKTTNQIVCFATNSEETQQVSIWVFRFSQWEITSNRSENGSAVSEASKIWNFRRTWVVKLN